MIEETKYICTGSSEGFQNTNDPGLDRIGNYYTPAEVIGVDNRIHAPSQGICR